MENSELSPEEKVKLERYENFLKETTGIYWRASVLFLFWLPIGDRLGSIITGMNMVQYENVPLFMPIWVNLSAFWMGMPIAFSWAGARYLMKKWATVAAATFTTSLILCVEIFVWSKGISSFLENLTYISGKAYSTILGLCFTWIMIYLAIEVKWPKLIWVIAAYLGLFLVIDYSFYRLLFPGFTWAGMTGERSALPHEALWMILHSGATILGVIMASLMAILSTEKIRRKVALREVLEHRDHR